MARLFFDRVAVGASDECWLWLGTINSQNKLTVAEADLVRQLRGVMTCTEVGLLFKISRSQVSRIQTGKKRGSELLP